MADNGRKKGRNPIVVGVGFLVVLVLMLLAVSFRQQLPVIGGGPMYTADFSEAAGLKSGDEVRVAGVRSGQVTGVALEGDRVRVKFQVQDTWLGDQTVAAIKIKTLLGQKYLSLDPQGLQQADPDVTIPLDRTVAPYDVVQAFSGLANTVGDIDTDQLATSFQTLSEAFSGTPENIRGALDGVTRLSQTISSRDQQLGSLLAASKQTTQLLSDRSAQFETLIQDAGTLLAELNNRRTAISALLTNTQDLSTQLRGLVADNQAQLGPVLAKLQGVVDLLDANLGNIDSGLALMAPFYRVFANTLGNGRWFDSTIANLLPTLLPGLPTIAPSPPSLNTGGN